MPNIFLTKYIPCFMMNTLCQKFPPAFTAAPLICELQLEQTSRSYLMAYFCILKEIEQVRSVMIYLPVLRRFLHGADI